jgi:gliding motility-associated-like protein
MKPGQTNHIKNKAGKVPSVAFPLLILILYLFPFPASGQCFSGMVTSDAPEICSGSTVDLGFSLAPEQSGSDESQLAVVAWQYSYTPDNTGSWTTFSGTAKTLTTGALARTTSYRVQYRYGGCAVQNSGPVTVAVHDPSVAGTLQGDADACESGNGGNITLTGQTGAIRQWYKRDATDPDWVPLNGTGASAGWHDLLLTTRYRAEVQSGVCPPAYSNEAVITIHPDPVPAFTASRTCDGDVTRFTNQSTVSDGYIGSYGWQFGDGSQSAQFNPQKQYYNSDTYQVTLSAVSDKNCTASVTRAVTVHPNPVSGFTAGDECAGASTRFTNTSRVRSGEGMAYKWEFGDDAQAATPSPEHLYAAPGVYRVRMVAVTATGLCRDSVERELAVFSLPGADAGRDTAVSAGHGVMLQAAGGMSYAWSPAEGLSNSMVANPFANPVQSTLYTVTVTDANGCVNTAAVNVSVNSDFAIHPYSVITPDGNGENDTWIVDHIERYPNARVRIINRWGEEVFHSQNYSNAAGWKGVNKKGDVLPEGAYYYIITLDGDSKVYRGAVTLLRR